MQYDKTFPPPFCSLCFVLALAPACFPRLCGCIEETDSEMIRVGHAENLWCPLWCLQAIKLSIGSLLTAMLA